MKCIVVQDCDGFSLYFWLHIEYSVSYYIIFCYVLSCSCLPSRRGGGRALRRGRRPQELLRHANTRSSFLMYLCLPVSSVWQMWNIVNLQFSSLERASRSLAKTVFFVFWGVFFWLPFLFVFLEAHEGRSGVRRRLSRFGSDLRSILGSFC